MPKQAPNIPPSPPVDAADASRSTRGARPGGPTRLAERRRRIRRIVDAAVELADEGGFEAVRARDVCERAGVTMGTLYRLFESKEEILLHAFAEDLVGLEEHFARRPAAGATAVERVGVLFRVSTQAFFARPSYARACIAAMASGQHRALVQLEAVVGRMTRLIHDALVGRDSLLEPTTGGTAIDDPMRAARILHRVWFSLIVGWAASVYSVDDLRNELHATTVYLLRGDTRARENDAAPAAGGERAWDTSSIRNV